MSIGFLKKFKKKRKNFTISAPHCGWRRKKRGGRIIKKLYKRAGSLFFDRKTSAACRRRAARALIRFPPAAPPRKNAAGGSPRARNRPARKSGCARRSAAQTVRLYIALFPRRVPLIPVRLSSARRPFPFSVPDLTHRRGAAPVFCAEKRGRGDKKGYFCCKAF